MSRQLSTMRNYWPFAAALLVCAGCASQWTAPAQPLADNPPLSSYAAAAPSAAPAATGASPTEMATVMAEIQEIGAQDPEAQQALLEDLKRTDPALWPQLVRVFRSSMAYHQQSAARLAQSSPQTPKSPTSTSQIIATDSARPSGQSQYMRQVGYSDPPGYPTTSYPTTTAPVRSASAPATSLPETADGALTPRASATEPAANYPDTMLPAVRITAVANARPLPAGDRIGVDTSSLVRTRGADWHESLAATIRLLESQAAPTGTQTSPADQARLRLLYLASGRKDDAANSLSAAAPDQQEFWNQELSGLAPLLEAERPSDLSHRAEEAARHLHAAAAELEQNNPLTLHHLTFATEVSSFGVYKPFPKYEFKPGQEALLYAEVENFTSTTTDQGFHTSLHSSYQILNSRGDRVANQDFAVTEEYCRNQRRDFFVRYFLNLPKSIPNGEYTLQLTVEDTQGNKSGQANIPFTVVGD